MTDTATPTDLNRYREFYADEIDAARLYRALAALIDDDRARIFLKIAETEERHAAHWAEVLREAGEPQPKTPRPSLRFRTLSFLARRFGVDSVLPIILRFEAGDAEKYRGEDAAPGSMAAQEVAHGRTVAAMGGVRTAGGRIALSEGRHRTSLGGALRASVFGANDGLVSNFSLVMGVAGATDDGRIVLLAGIAGLFAGAFSMAAGEWVSVRSQRELYEREISIESEELAHFPEEEAEELELIYQAKGLGEDEAKALVRRIMADPRTALDTLVREELGMDPNDLASPWVAAFSSFFAFGLGATLPVLPFLFTTGNRALVVAAVLSAVGLFLVGASISVFTRRPSFFSGLRMVLVGGAAAALTYGIGTLVGVTVT